MFMFDDNLPVDRLWESLSNLGATQLGQHVAGDEVAFGQMWVARQDKCVDTGIA
jgi:hypothetical protein